MKDFIYSIFDPATGLIWFYPMVLLSIFFLKSKPKNFVILTSSLLSLLFFMINNQYYTHQIGLRYLNYLYPAFFFIFEIKNLKINILLTSIFIGMSLLLTVGQNTNLDKNSDGMNLAKRYLIAFKVFSKDSQLR